MQDILSSDENLKNKEIFKYLRDTDYIPSFEDIDNAMGFNSRYSYKFASPNNSINVKKLHTLALETLYNIPSTLFFNKNITKYSDIEKYIQEYRQKSGIYIKNRSPMSLDAFKEFKYLYILDNDTKANEYRIDIKDLKLSIFDSSNNKEKYRGYINVSCSSIICIIQNSVTQNTIIFKILLKFLTSDKIIPFTFLGHKPSTNEEVAEYGIFSKEQLDNKTAVKLLDLEDIKFPDIEKELIARIKNNI